MATQKPVEKKLTLADLSTRLHVELEARRDRNPRTVSEEDRDYRDGYTDCMMDVQLVLHMFSDTEVAH